MFLILVINTPLILNIIIFFVFKSIANAPLSFYLLGMINYSSELITWSSTFSCGIAVIDEQHKKLIKLINNLFLHTTGNQEMEKHFFNLVIKEVIKYIKVHFATEERILNATKYPGYEKHKRAHKSFILTILDVVADYKSGKRHTLATISKFLKNWALSHIAIMDKAYFDYLLKIASRKPDGRLTISIKENNTELKKAG